MPGSSAFFDYPIQRPYPWRFTTSSILAASITVLILLGYFNLAIAGLASISYSSTTFIKSGDPSWVDRMNLGKMLNRTIGCEPTTLVSGGTYKTQNGLFSYPLERIISEENGQDLSMIAYDGSVIENCTIISIGAWGDYSKPDLHVGGKVQCFLPGGIQLRTSFQNFMYPGTPLSPLNQYYDLKVTDETYLARTANLLVAAFMLDVRDSFYFVVGEHSSTYAPCDFYVAGQSTKNPLPGVITCLDDFLATDQAQTLLTALDNYMQVVWSAVLLDFGVNTSQNILTDTQLMLRSFRPYPSNSSISPPYVHGATDEVLANTTGFGLPIKQSPPTSFNARYLCHRMWWKSPNNLVLDVTVATVSLFMAYWAMLSFALRYFATRSAPHRNYCLCPSCSELPQHTPTLPETCELRSLDSRTMYKSFPTRSQSTPS
ncbi:hypothetical protein BDV93DRAFT_548523 [Ceratobasidium sp. AG-I]|nr:hypothetical protein BDV93DRAFT_548523 [Ceratobasidium sp. AG-I]